MNNNIYEGRNRQYNDRREILYHVFDNGKRSSRLQVNKSTINLDYTLEKTVLTDTKNISFNSSRIHMLQCTVNIS